MAKSFAGFSSYQLLPPDGLGVKLVCSCCGAYVLNEKASGAAASILVASNLSEEQMRACLQKPLEPRVGMNEEYRKGYNKKLLHGWEFLSVPLAEGENLSLLLQLPKEA